MPPRHLVLLKVDQQLRQPLAVITLGQTSDQRGTVGTGSGGHVE
jgi:hypothetical protein